MLFFCKIMINNCISFFILVRPTLDVLQKARSNIENHLKETNNTPPGSAQSYHRHHRPNRQD
jgi:hypothetical protein